MTTYRVTTKFCTFTFRANLSEAAAPITVCHTGDGEYVGTQYQTGDARHFERRAAILLIADGGSDFWLDPTERDLLDEIGRDAYIDRLIKSVEPVYSGNAVEDCDTLYDSDTAESLTADELEMTADEYEAAVAESMDAGTAEGHIRLTNGRRVYAA